MALQQDVRSRSISSTSGRILGLAGILLGLFSLATSLLPGNLSFLILGLLILSFGLLQNLAGFALGDSSVAESWFARGGTSILTGALLIAIPKMTFAGLAVVMGISWITGGGSLIVTAIRDRRQAEWIWRLIDGIVNILLGIAIALQWPVGGIVSVSVFVGLRYLSAGWSSLIGAPQTAVETAIETPDQHPDLQLGIAPHPYVSTFRDELLTVEPILARGDRGWCWLFLITFFAIHAARMDTAWTFIGFLSPAGAVAGDVLLAIVLAYSVAAPVSVAWRRLTRGIERRSWTWYLRQIDQNTASRFRAGIVHWWLGRRMLAALRKAHARGSATAAAGWGLRTGLPPVAVLMAITPLWGVSWVFDTETWVTGAWQVWADQRTDTWRVNMVEAVRKEYGVGANNPDFFRVSPEGLETANDFSFVVIGDTGEGDASQLILRDQLLRVGQKPEVKFLVLSSDVIYPAGAMKDYEPKFYLPFKGFQKPIYAVPGNHDWYDALESFAANFLEPQAARAALRGRREADLKLTTTSEADIDAMVLETERLRGEYQIETAKQRATYFEIRTEHFSLIVADTGILRRLDDDQFRWLDQALERGRDRFKMVILGHPVYAAGKDQSEDVPDFKRVHELLKKHAVDVVMGGDTHDFEYYQEQYMSGDESQSMYHFVNGGGGAYLSIGTALDWPKQPPVEECGFYPRADALTAIIEARTPTWKRPMWLWVKYLDAWPSSAELLASAFNYDRAPFYQSFMEVRVEGSTNTVKFWLYGANGRLNWRDLHVEGDRIPNGHAIDEPVEFSFSLREDI
jgi:uncharacterized membrane protein HdeD (DUF308 family)